MDWEEAKKKLHPCVCGCPTVEIFAQGNDDCLCYAECGFCGKTSESSFEPCEVISDWNLRGGECVECGMKCNDPEDELCQDCWDAGIKKTDNAAGEVRRNAVTSTGLLADESKGGAT